MNESEVKWLEQRIDELEAQISELTEALEFYADDYSHSLAQKVLTKWKEARGE